MTTDITGIVDAIEAEARADYVGLWVVMRDIAALEPEGDSDTRVGMLEAITEELLHRGVCFGQFNSQQRFMPWPSEDVVARMTNELNELGRAPDIGEIGWFVLSANGSE